MSVKVFLILILLIELCVGISIQNHETIFNYFEILIINELVPNNPTIKTIINKIFDIIGRGSFGKIYRIKPKYGNEFTRNLAFKVVYAKSVC